MIEKKIVIAASLIIILLVSLVLYLELKEKKHKPITEKAYHPTEYEKEVISYFKEITLNSEFGDKPKKITKWIEPMVLYIVKKEELKPQMLVIKNTINKINELATDGFKIELTNDHSKSNSTLYLCDQNKLTELAPYFHDILTDGIDYTVSGYAYSEFMTHTNIIDKSLIFINLEEPIDIQESTIIEEITQSLGLAFDSQKYTNSIFYENKFEQEVRIKEYSKIDIDIIKLLYHPKMKPGVDSIQLDKVITEIFKSERD